MRSVLPLPLARSIRMIGVAAFAVVVAIAASVKMSAQNPAAPIAQPPTIGANVNMVAGPTYLRLPPVGLPQKLGGMIQGDPLQNPNGFEGQCAFSTRNPLKILCFANDNSVVDVLGVDNGTADEGNGDSTVGVYESSDGGRSFTSTVHPNFFPKALGLDYAADPGAWAGPNGLVYHVGLASNRGDKPIRKVYLSVFIDLNDQESDRYPFKYLYTTTVDVGSSLRKDDRPSVLVMPPQPGGPRCELDVDRGDGTIVHQSVLASPVHVFWSVFTGSGNNLKSQQWMKSSFDCGRTYTNGYKLSEEIGLSQGLQATRKIGTNTICAAWRKGTDPQVVEGISIACSKDGGLSFTKGNPSFSDGICPVDWTTKPTRFRTLTVPTITADTQRFYMAWAERPRDANGVCLTESSTNFPDAAKSRIMVTTSTDGVTWDKPYQAVPYTDPGFQLMPQLSYSGNYINLLWFDSKNSAGRLGDGSRPLQTTLDEQPIVVSKGVRHTIETFGARALPGASPTWSTPFRVSKYTFGVKTVNGVKTTVQLQHNPPDVRLFAKNNVPGMGDYIGLTSEQLVPNDPINSPGSFAENIGQLGDSYVFANWADNRNVRLHSNEDYSKPRDWTPSAIPNVPNGSTAAMYDPTQPRPACSADATGMRDQNPYGALWTDGSLIGAYGNNRPMLVDAAGRLTGQPRTMSLFAQNLGTAEKLFQFVIMNDPRGGTARFSQSGQATLDACTAQPSGVGSDRPCVEAVAAPNTTVVRTAFVTSSQLRPAMKINVFEVTLSSNPVSQVCVITGGVCSTLAGRSVKAISANHGFNVGDYVTITGANPTAYNGTFAITSVPDANTFQYQLGADVTIVAAQNANIAAKAPLRNTTRFARTVWFNADPNEPATLRDAAVAPGDENSVNRSEVTDIDIVTPFEASHDISNAVVTNQGWAQPGWEEPGWEEPGWEEPGWEEPGWEEPGWEEPGWEEPGWEEPGWEEPGWEEAGWETNAVTSSDLQQPGGVTIRDIRFKLRIKGNTTHLVNVANLLNGQLPDGVRFQFVAYKINASLAGGPNSCGGPQLVANKDVLVNIDNTNVSYGNFTSPLDSSSLQNATIPVGPRQTIYANLRLFGTGSGATLPTADSILLKGTASGKSATSALGVLEVFRPPIGFTLNPYSFQFQAVGGQACSPPLQYTWSSVGNLPAGLTFSSSGRLAGTPTAASSYTVKVDTNSCTPTSDTATFNLALVRLPALAGAEATSANGAAVTYSTPVENHNDATDGPLNVVCTPSSGSTFALFPLDAEGGKGHTTTVACSATDNVGNAGSGTFSVTVRDTTPPGVATPVANPITIWTGTNKKAPVTVSGGPGAITDSASGVASANFFVVDEYGLDQPSGSVTVNADGSYSFTVSLTGNRNSSDSNGRTYQIFVRATDKANNVGISPAAIVTAINK